MRVLIADDEALVRRMLREALAQEPDILIVSECRSGAEALVAAEEVLPDVLFLDVRMPGLTGLDVASRLRGAPMPLIVFVTAYDAHAVKAFELNAVDYLLKPFDVERVRATVRRVRERLAQRRSASHGDMVERPSGPDAHAAHDLTARVKAVLETLTHLPTVAPTDRFLVSLAGRMRVIPATDVEWIEADGNYARLHLTKGSALLRETMKALEARLAPAQFIRVHRSALVRVTAIRELEPTASGDYRVHLASGAKVVMSRSYRDEVLRHLGPS